MFLGRFQDIPFFLKTIFIFQLFQIPFLTYHSSSLASYSLFYILDYHYYTVILLSQLLLKDSFIRVGGGSPILGRFQDIPFFLKTIFIFQLFQIPFLTYQRSSLASNLPFLSP
jgi:hypothetical protein